MGTSALFVALIAATATGASISPKNKQKQNDFFRRYWGTEFVWKFDDLPQKGRVPEERTPYSGYIYPDKQGGTASALRKYDRAFNGGRYRATAYEQWDTTAFKKRTPGGLFGLGMRMETPNWHGHCNGWAAAAIRHAAPEKAVRYNGVVFSPADVKALLAEMYIYNDLAHLAGLYGSVNAGEFHALITNWVGRGSHGLGMEADPGEEKWNYPVYAYSSSHAKRSNGTVEVKMNLAYAKDTNGEYQESPHVQRVKYFHYQLYLNARGEIIGGYYFRDSSIIDMVWVPMRPKEAGRQGNKPGNPHIRVDNVLAVWRASVPEEKRENWLVIDPVEKDRLADISSVVGLVPVQDLNAPAATTPVAITNNAEAETSVGDEEPSETSVDGTSETTSENAAATEETTEATSVTADAPKTESAEEAESTVGEEDLPAAPATDSPEEDSVEDIIDRLFDEDDDEEDQQSRPEPNSRTDVYEDFGHLQWDD